MRYYDAHAAEDHRRASDDGLIWRQPDAKRVVARIPQNRPCLIFRWNFGTRMSGEYRHDRGSPSMNVLSSRSLSRRPHRVRHGRRGGRRGRRSGLMTNDRRGVAQFLHDGRLVARQDFQRAASSMPGSTATASARQLSQDGDRPDSSLMGAPPWRRAIVCRTPAIPAGCWSPYHSMGRSSPPFLPSRRIMAFLWAPLRVFAPISRHQTITFRHHGVSRLGLPAPAALRADPSPPAAARWLLGLGAAAKFQPVHHDWVPAAATHDRKNAFGERAGLDKRRPPITMRPPAFGVP